jgi:hypothetical protein
MTAAMRYPLASAAFSFPLTVVLKYKITGIANAESSILITALATLFAAA